MQIELKESIHAELKAVGLKPGQIINSNEIDNITGAIYFRTFYNTVHIDCVVYPEDYKIVSNNLVSISITEGENISVPASVTEMSVPIATITETLDAMYWCFSPYMDETEIFPWLENLIKSYNDLVDLLPSPHELMYEKINM